MAMSKLSDIPLTPLTRRKTANMELLGKEKKKTLLRTAV